MPKWIPEPIWEGEEVFIIGGGDSLRHGFDWNLLIPEHTIGCNNAFRLGPEICDICMFADRKFIFDGGDKHRKGFYDGLANFPNLVVTNDNGLKLQPEPWIKWIPRKPLGLHHEFLGFNFSVGAGAINLALLLGAQTIYLLGFDMQLSKEGKPNWHDHQIDKPSKDVYARMIGSFGNVSRDLAKKFPGKKVFNITDNSKLRVFPKIPFEKFWAERRLPCVENVA